ncbi:DinB superfamily protein [Chitinophaga costaii]|uniref:DinB superfamily protein n=1 Tax=Chitinophaga costaii TaxID=1335309 RepID=A0A1C4AH29_9BACT|nr:DinB family protein [Chitinophaga costaii]PUZ26600.1 DinB family protein [Chitinophaga costaii]SCB93900.1 DinB superfamily protein [Chitinophaga costaii]
MNKDPLQHLLPGTYPVYIDLTANIPLDIYFKQSIADLAQLETFRPLANKAYAADKWTVNDVILHMADTERIFQYRALVFARNDKIVLPAFDQEEYAGSAKANQRSFDSILQEFLLVKQNTQSLFSTFDDEALLRSSKFSKYVLPVLAIGYTIVGHQQHHLNILEARYKPLL